MKGAGSRSAGAHSISRRDRGGRRERAVPERLFASSDFVRLFVAQLASLLGNGASVAPADLQRSAAS
jgi:hypothetical protein